MILGTLVRSTKVLTLALLCLSPQRLNADNPPTALKEVGGDGVQIVYESQGQLFHCVQFDIREVVSSNEAIARTRVSSGNLTYFTVIGVEEGMADITVWPKEPDVAPILVTVRVSPNPEKYAALSQSIMEKLNVAVTITQIPNSKKIRVSGEVQDYGQAQRVVAYITGENIRPNNLVNELRWKCVPCCHQTTTCIVIRRQHQ
jgi:hypothetical protein